MERQNRWSNKSSFIWGSCVILFGITVACELPTKDPGGCFLTGYSGPNSPGKELGIGVTELGGASVAQSFTPTKEGSARTATVRIQKVGTFVPGADVLTATLENNTGTGMQLGTPTGTPLGTSVPINISLVSSGATDATFEFGSPIALQKGNIYWLRVKASYPINKMNYVQWEAFDGAAGGYSVGGVFLNALYESSQSANSFSSAVIGAKRFLLFNIGC